MVKSEAQMYRAHFHNIVLPSCLDCVAPDVQAARNHAIEHLKVFFAAQQIPEDIAHHFIASIEDLSVQEMEALLQTFSQEAH
jgi:hypothetical protein